MEGHMEIPSLSSSSPPFPTSPPSIYVSLSRPGSHPATHVGLELMAILLSQHPDINHYFQLLLFNCWNKTNPTPSRTPCPCSLEHYLTTWFSGAQATVQWNRSTLWKFHSGSGYADGRTTVKSHRDKAPGFLDPFWNQEGQATHQQSRKLRDIPLITSAEHKTGRCQENHETVHLRAKFKANLPKVWRNDTSKCKLHTGGLSCSALPTPISSSNKASGNY